MVNELFISLILDKSEGNKIFNSFRNLIEMRNDSIAVLKCFRFFSSFLCANTNDLKSTFDMNSSLVVVNLMSCTKSSHCDKKFMADLLEIVQNQDDSFLDCVKKWPFDILEFS